LDEIVCPEVLDMERDPFTNPCLELLILTDVALFYLGPFSKWDEDFENREGSVVSVIEVVNMHERLQSYVC
jgi:hypothetical protein